MAPRDRTTDSDTGDWFDNAAVVDATPSVDHTEHMPERRFTVLTEQPPYDADPGDGWFDNNATDGTEDDLHHPVRTPPADRRSFDDRTTALRAKTPYSATASPSTSWWRRHRAGIAVTAAVAVLVAGLGGAVLLLTGPSSEPDSPVPLLPDEIIATTVPTSAAPAAAGAAAADVTWCSGQADGEPVTEDSADPGAVAIWRFEKAFYFDRDGTAARAAGTPDAVMASAQRLQTGIAQLEPDIEFCVLADPIDASVYDVTVVERGPGIDGRMSRQRITTTKTPDGRTLISAIVSR